MVKKNMETAVKGLGLRDIAAITCKQGCRFRNYLRTIQG